MQQGASPSAAAPLCKQHQCRVSRCGCVANVAASRSRYSAPVDARPVQQDVAVSRGRYSAPVDARPVQQASNQKRSKCRGTAVGGAKEWEGRHHTQEVQKSSPRKDGAKRSPPFHRRSAPALPVLTDLNECVEELYLESSSQAPASVSIPASPSNFELTESVLRKSQFLLKQLSDLNLDADYKVSTPDAQDAQSHARATQSQSGCSHVSSRISHLQTARSHTSASTALETVEVPVVFLKMLSEQWEERCAAQSSIGCGTVHSSASGTTACDEARKNCPYHFSSMSSLMSAASTLSPRLASEETFSSDSTTGSAPSAKFEPPMRSAPLRSARPALSRYSPPLVAAPTLALSPRRGAMEGPAQIQRVVQAAPGLLRQASLQHLGVCQRQPVPATPGRQSVTVTATAPAGSSVSVTLGTSHSSQGLSSVCITTC